ncbi:MAG: hypothetical protein IPJ13_23860 [Saprospiraceae bacterium]|nr:hypothetical protein [Saprospiraceae bacterium]
MQWSNGLKDLGATFIPKIAGEVQLNGCPVKATSPKNWIRGMIFRCLDIGGDLPFTSGPSYYGAIIVFLFIFGFLVLKIKQSGGCSRLW